MRSPTVFVGRIAPGDPRRVGTARGKFPRGLQGGRPECIIRPVSQPLRARSGLDEEALAAWVLQPQLTADDGRILSWLDAAGTGYPYEEATAFYARLYAWMGRAADAVRLGTVLEARLSDASWLRRGESSYLFDTALALEALPHPEPVVARVVDWIHQRRACDPVTRPGRWSESFGAHLIKVATPLAALGRRRVAEALVDDLVESCFDGARFRIHPASELTYVHSHCYALEGLVGLGLSQHAQVARLAADWLADVQEPSGAFVAWFGDGGPDAARPVDVVAQAIRIWAALDPARYADAIALGLRRLAEHQDPSTGGLAYTLGSGHLNSWAAAFALQAIRWAAKPPDARELRWLI